MFLPWQVLSSVPGPGPQAAGQRGGGGEPSRPPEAAGSMAGSQVQMSFGGGISVSPQGPPSLCLPMPHRLMLSLPHILSSHCPRKCLLTEALLSYPGLRLDSRLRGAGMTFRPVFVGPLAGSGYPKAPAHVPRSPLCLQPPEPVRSTPPVLCPPGQHTLPFKVISVGAPGLLSLWSVLLGVRAPCPGVEIT